MSRGSIVALAFLVTTGSAACSPPPAAATPDSGPASKTAPSPATPASSATQPAASGRLGRVLKIADDVWAIVPVDDDSRRFCFRGPLATPSVLIDGKKVRFEGVPGPPPPPNVRVACTLFEYTSVVAAD